MRLDKLLCELNIGTRSEVKTLLKKGLIKVNGQIIKKPEEKVDEFATVISYNGHDFSYEKYRYYMMNKPSGVISATEDGSDRTVLDVFHSFLPDEKCDDLFPVGRLDKDTVGLLILTNDGQLAHDWLSPKKHVDKKYLVKLDKTLTADAISQLEQGVSIGEGDLTMPCHVEQLADTECFITIQEGKFHQVKRMFFAVGLEVIYLKRISMGPVVLDENLKEGEVRKMLPSE